MRLLIAEDEQELANALTAILKHNNYSVDTVYDGEDALAYLQTGLYDAAVLDIMMPKMDGLSVLKHKEKICRYFHGSRFLRFVPHYGYHQYSKL